MDWKKAYLNLFNKITDAQIHVNKADEILKKAQQESELLFIEDTDNNSLKIFCNKIKPSE